MLVATVLLGGCTTVNITVEETGDQAAAPDAAGPRLDAMASASPDLKLAPVDMTPAALPPDLWMCAPVKADCTYDEDCCNDINKTIICSFPLTGVQPQHLCCRQFGSPCSTDDECCLTWPPNPSVVAYCDQTKKKCWSR